MRGEVAQNIKGDGVLIGAIVGRAFTRCIRVTLPVRVPVGLAVVVLVALGVRETAAE